MNLKEKFDKLRNEIDEYESYHGREFVEAVCYQFELRYYFSKLGYAYKKQDMKEGDYYVYLAFYDNELVYVGSGKGERWKHVNSGVSHNKVLNRMHFEGKKMFVHAFVDGISKEDSLYVENIIIKLMNPVANSKNKFDNSFVRNCGSLCNAWLEDRIDDATLRKYIEL